jgi:cytochrome c peroxidase
MKIRTIFFILLTIAVFLACNKDQIITEKVNKTVALEIPSHFPPPIDFSDNPLTVKGIELGRKLFYDPRLSLDSSQSCASCHQQDVNFSDFNQFSEGVDGILGDKNAMAIVNLAWGSSFFWDGRSESMEEQAFEPVTNPIEMHETWENVVKKLKADPRYVDLFEQAFGENSITDANATNAIAQFERTMISANSKYDKGFLMDPPFANFDSLEFLGYTIFNNETGDCFHCHAEPLFGAYGTLQFSNNGLDSNLQVGSGREGVTNNPNDRGKFKITTLRNIEFSFPYMHDGRFTSLYDVIEFYDTGGNWSPTIDPNMKAVGVGRNWSPTEKAALLAFLKTLTDYEYLGDTTFSNPFQ